MRKKTTEEFIIDAKKVHGDRYDYSLVEYKGCKMKIKIICSKHGTFQQRPNNHQSGQGCPSCNKGVLFDRSIFINKSIKVHGDRYDYSLVNYINSKIKVKIICKIHGVFEQIPNSHLLGNGCIKCVTNTIKNNKFFITECISIHGNRYDYSLVNYINSKTKVEIICKKHGSFKQIPNSHLNGNGCPICVGLLKKTKSSFIEESVYIHGNKYDYSLVDYINIKTKVKIICKKHGVFIQVPNAHLCYQGCPKCSISKGENRVLKWLIDNNIKYEHQKTYKGCSYKYKLPFDFYIPDYNMCIEYDGIQHFEIREFLGGSKGFKERKRNDKIKTNYCKDNNIKLVRIPYWDFENIEEILNSEIK